MHKPVSPGSKQSPGQPPKQWRQWRALGICLPPGCWFPIAASERRCRSGGQHVLISGTGSGGCLPPMRRSRGCSADGAVAHPFHQLTQAGTGRNGQGVTPYCADHGNESRSGSGRMGQTEVLSGYRESHSSRISGSAGEDRRRLESFAPASPCSAARGRIGTSGSRVSARSRRRRSSLARAGTSSRGSRRATCRRGRASPRRLRLRRPAATSRSQGG